MIGFKPSPESYQISSNYGFRKTWKNLSHYDYDPCESSNLLPPILTPPPIARVWSPLAHLHHESPRKDRSSKPAAKRPYRDGKGPKCGENMQE